MEIGTIQEFVVLAECLNFSEAASRLFISQSSLSKHIKALEQELGVALFERTTRSIRLSGAGAVSALRQRDCQTLHRIRNGDG